MLRKIRQTIATLLFFGITLLMLDFTGTLHSWLGWLARIQFLPTFLAINVGVILFLVLSTFFFGRIYCSVICPLGVLQDLVARWGRFGKKMPYSYSTPKTVLRYGVLAVFLFAIVAELALIVALLDPYGAYGRIVSNLFLPIWQWGNNLLAIFSERADSYAFYTVEVWIKSLSVFVVAIISLFVVAMLAWSNGRTYCNTICPVGTLLGFISKYSFFTIEIDDDKCNKCGICAHNCKASCIDSKTSTVDTSRCVVCMNCIGKCHKEAIGYTFRYVKPSPELKKKNQTVSSNIKIDEGRKGFLATTLFMVVSTLKAQVIPKATDIKMDGGLADIIDKKAAIRENPIIPAGSYSLRNLQKHCTACQLCVSVCDNNVLRPSTSIDYLMQPQMSFERGYCRPECVKCSEVCPAGAILQISKADKSSTQVGHAVWLKEQCIPIRDGQTCDNCERHCPTKAIIMIASDSQNERSLKIPAINVERCIGCGACEFLCPARPYSAIYVEGHAQHKTI